MVNADLGKIIAHLDGMLAAPDGQLLGRFVEARDEASFAALVRRHGPMVLGVCWLGAWRGAAWRRRAEAWPRRWRARRRPPCRRVWWRRRRRPRRWPRPANWRRTRRRPRP